MTTAAGPNITPREPTSLPALRAADQGVADALESVLSDNTPRLRNPVVPRQLEMPAHCLK